MQSAPEREDPQFVGARGRVIERALAPLRRLAWAIDREAAAERSAREPGSDRAPAIACCVAALSLVFMEYTSERDVMGLVYRLRPGLYDPAYAQLYELSVWIAVRLLAFFALPALAIRLLLRERLRDHGLAVAGLRGHFGGYLILFALVLPCIALAASRPEFSTYYPFYSLASASWCDLAYWETLYALHFIALEFFFRGFWLTACRRSFGSQAVYVALVPYCMIHFTKPLLEVLAAIPAGIALGLLAMRARSIWGGAALHIAVAYTMDALALWKTTGFPSTLLR